MDKYAVKGLKKLFGLCATKIRLAREAGTVDVRPSPLPLVKLYAGVDLNTVSECAAFRSQLKDEIDYGDEEAVASAVLKLCDIIEGVKYDYEPLEYMPLLGGDELSRIEKECVESGGSLTILLMTPDGKKGSLYVGDNPPAGVRHYSRVVSGVAPLLHFLYGSDYVSDGRRLSNIIIEYGGGTLLGAAVRHAIVFFCE